MPADEVGLVDLAAAGDVAVRAATVAWGASWDRDVEVQLACDDAQYAAIAGSFVTAAETVPRETDAGRLRIVLRRSAFAAPDGTLTANGARAREVVLRHEMVHIATKAPFDSSVPLWLEEGIATMQSYAGSGVSPSDQYADVRDARGGPTGPTRLPADEAFRGLQSAAAYGQSQLAVEILARQLGQAGLVALYREVSAGTPVADAITRRTGWSERDFLARWRDRLAQVARA